MAYIKYSKEEKLDILAWYHEGNTLLATAKKYGVSDTTILNWQSVLESGHPDGLNEVSTRRRYSAELKQKVVTAVLSGEGTVREIAKRFGLRYPGTIYIWLRKYTEGELNKSTSGGRSQVEGRRKTSYKERLKIVEYCLSHGLNYMETAKLFNVSYDQVYSWVRKYEEKGAQGLEDRRGKAKNDSDLSEEDRLRREIRELKEKNLDLEYENLLLKKLKELERESH